ncbi:cupin domain-containing protein [Trinickia caryophylli]|nr:cupin domain-containing protein [Trinickia caryophylli]WQE15183.1 cupin domain-containing protein [Trinickia caryophylli]
MRSIRARTPAKRSGAQGAESESRLGGGRNASFVLTEDCVPTGAGRVPSRIRTNRRHLLAHRAPDMPARPIFLNRSFRMDNAAQFTFRDLIAPLSADQFFSDYWETKPLHLARDQQRHYAQLISATDVETMLAEQDIRHPGIRLAKGGRYLAPDTYSTDMHYGDDLFRGVPDLDVVYAHYRTGATVILPALHRTWAPLNRLCAAMEAELNHVVHTNLYLTPGGTAGFSAHYDAHEVFILQIDGRKHWRIYEPPLLLPHHTQPFSPAGYVLPPPMFEIDLMPGDLLYLPRGYVHDTLTSDDHSAHVTLGISVYTWVELLAEALAACKERLDLRRALPPGFANSAQSAAQLASTLGEILGTLQAAVESQAVVDSFKAKVLPGTIKRRGHFTPHASTIGTDTRLYRLPPGRFEVSREEGQIALMFDGKSMKVPDYAGEAIEIITRGESFLVRDLASSLGLDGSLTLAHALFLAGFVTAEPAAALV